MDGCLFGCLMKLTARFGPERVGDVLLALAQVAADNPYLDCDLVNRELSARGLTGVTIDEPALGLAVEALRRAGVISAEPVIVN